jgi:hypothetical protein
MGWARDWLPRIAGGSRVSDTLIRVLWANDIVSSLFHCIFGFHWFREEAYYFGVLHIRIEV